MKLPLTIVFFIQNQPSYYLLVTRGLFQYSHPCIRPAANLQLPNYKLILAQLQTCTCPTTNLYLPNYKLALAQLQTCTCPTTDLHLPNYKLVLVQLQTCTRAIRSLTDWGKGAIFHASDKTWVCQNSTSCSNISP